MPITEGQAEAARKIMESILPPEHYDRARRVDRGLDNQGHPVIDPRDFMSLRSPDGSVWRVRVSNTGVLTTKKET